VKFEYEFENDPQYGILSVEHYVEGDERVKISSSDNNVWISANSKGWLKLAKICIEMGMRDLEDGFHFHSYSDLKLQSKQSLEISFELDNDLE